MWPSSNCSLVRASTSRAPSAMATSTARGLSGEGVPICSISGPRLIATMCSTLGGISPRDDTACSTKSASSAILSASLCSRSKPIVDEDLWSRDAPPQAEPPRWPGQTSTSSASVSSRSWSERKIAVAPSRASTARSGLATSPTKSESPLSTAHGSSPREVSKRTNEVCSGRCPSVSIASTRTSPSSSDQPSAIASCAYSASASSLMWMVAPVARASRPWPETWSAWLCVSRTCSIFTPCRRARRR